jgi:hypothetical protein
MTQATPHPARAPLRLSLLGSFSLVVGGRRASLPIHAQRVLAYLSIAQPGRSAYLRSSLAERLWSDVTTERARASLRTALWRIRQADKWLVRASRDTVTRQWLRGTESLFFRDLPSASIGAITSTLRPDFAATRRNAFHRMLGMDLNHGRDDGQPYPYVHAAAAHTGFVPMFEDLLREVWIAAENFKNTSGTNPKDDAAIANLARDIRDMLRTRRQQGNLAREEFWIVTMASWFHLILESNNSVITDLKSNAGSPEERLRKIGDRVGLKPHVHAESFFILAPRLSVLLKRIEAGDYNSPSSVSVLYSENAVPPPNPIRKDMLDIINQWSIATGRDMKARRTTITPRTATLRPTSKPLSPAGVLSTSNGSKG